MHLAGLLTDDEIQNCRELFARQWPAISAFMSATDRDQAQLENDSDSRAVLDSTDSQAQAVCERIRRLCLSEPG